MDSVPVAPTVRQAFQYRLDPTPEQARALGMVLARCREVYHAALEERREAWRRRGIWLSYYDQQRELPGSKDALAEFRAVHAHVLQDVILRVARAFQACFRRVQAGEAPGSPRFHGRHRYHRFTFPQYGNGAVLDGGVLNRSKIGRGRLRVHRPLEGTPKTVTSSQEADGWYASLWCADVPTQPLPPPGQQTGIDLGLESFATLAEGSQIATPRILHVAQMHLRRAQRRVSRRVKGSQRRRKAVRLLARAQQQVRRARADVQHTTALVLGRQYATIYHEAVQTANLVQHHSLAKGISEAGWSAFLPILAATAADAGKRVVAVPPACTSPACSSGGALVEQALSVRWHACPAGGTSRQRAQTAALHSLRLGRTVRPGWPFRR